LRRLKIKVQQSSGICNKDHVNALFNILQYNKRYIGRRQHLHKK